MKKKILTLTLAALAAFLTASPLGAVFNERNLAQTLRVLRYELSKSYREMSRDRLLFEKQDEKQHVELVKLMNRSNELALMLYSQKQDFTFDLTYALQQITDQYRDFRENRIPYDQRIEYLNVEIERYGRLVSTLKSLPPAVVEKNAVTDMDFLDSLTQASLDEIIAELHQFAPPDASFLDRNALDAARANALSTNLDSLARIDRDSCLFFSSRLLGMFTDIRNRLVADSERYELTDSSLRQAYDYARARYDIVQKNIFIDGQPDMVHVLRNLRDFAGNAFKAAGDKYGRGTGEAQSEWQGAIVIGFSILVLFYLLVATLLSNLVVRLSMRKVRLFKTAEFQKRKLTLILLAAVVIFILAMLAGKVLVPEAHFFQMASSLVIEYSLLLVAILSSMLVRHAGAQLNRGLRIYAPILLLGLLIIAFRIIFIPNDLLTLVFPPLLILFGLWQRLSLRRNGDQVPRIDRTFAWISFAVTAAAFVMSCFGYVLMSVQLYIWWIFQLTVIQLIGAFRDLLRLYRRNFLEKRVRAFRMQNANLVQAARNATIAITWFYDLLEMTVIPLLTVLSVPFSLYMASRVFDLTEIGMKLFSYPFLNYNFIQLSLYKIVLAAGLYFLFRYISYSIKAFYGSWKLHGMIRRSPSGHIHENEINLTLAHNVIGILVWGTFAIVTVGLLQIPTKSLSVVTAGLAAGLGFAMRDILNNFFYGIQLMSGRLRVGDYIECDGIRGKVADISYQTTQIASVDGSLIAFQNSDLFSKNFKNLTRNNSYEYVAVPVGIAYGTDVDRARKVILKAMGPLRRPDRYGRQVVQRAYGIKVTLNNFGDSSVNLMVKQYVLVEERSSYLAMANEMIYKALNEANIEIPFPQRDIHIKHD